MATKIKIVMDRSGSMTSIAATTVEKFNEYINKVKVERGKKKILVSLYQFDDRYNVVYEDVPVEEVQDLVNGVTFVPRGMTALLDAIGKTMGGCGSELKKKDTGICVIITDGFENMSKEWTNESVAKLIAELEDKHGWTFVYLGANQDAFNTAQQFGIRNAANAMSYGNNEIGTTAMYSSLARATVRSAAGPGGQSIKEFFTEEELADAEKTR